MNLWSELNRLVALGNDGASSVDALLTQLHNANQSATDTDTTYDIPALLARRNAQRYCLLHTAIFSRSLSLVRTLVAHGADVNIKCHGSSCLHLALAVYLLPGGEEFGLECLRLLLQQPTCLVTAKVSSALED